MKETCETVHSIPKETCQLLQVQTPSDVVRLVIVLSVVSSLKSVHSRFYKMSSSTQCAWYVQHSQDFWPWVQYVYKKHLHNAKSWPLCCISPASAPSVIALFLSHSFLSFSGMGFPVRIMGTGTGNNLFLEWCLVCETGNRNRKHLWDWSSCEAARG